MTGANIPAEFLFAFAGYQALFIWALWLIWWRAVDNKNGNHSCLLFALFSAIGAIFIALISVWSLSK